MLGNTAAIPLLLLHGGPGFPSDYLEPLAALAGDRPVVFYDQLGCGRSSRPDDDALWAVERYVRELLMVRRTLGLDRVHLFGHSWGALLALESLRTSGNGVMSLVLASPAINLPRWQQDTELLRQRLPAPVVALLDRCMANGDFGSPAFLRGVTAYNQSYICRLNGWPPALVRSFEGSGAAPYLTLWGPAEFLVTGRLRGHDASPLLRGLSMPVLFTCGRYDEATPETTAWYHSLVPHSTMCHTLKSRNGTPVCFATGFGGPTWPVRAVHGPD